MFSLESPHRGDSNEYIQHAIINIKKSITLNCPNRGDSNEYTQPAIIKIKKSITLNYPKYNNVCSCGTQERVKNNRQ